MRRSKRSRLARSGESWTSQRKSHRSTSHSRQTMSRVSFDMVCQRSSGKYGTSRSQKNELPHTEDCGNLRHFNHIAPRTRGALLLCILGNMQKDETRHATLYRTYRPQSFKEVRGQAHVVDVLAKAIKNNKPAHAYLFAGGRGGGGGGGGCGWWWAVGGGGG